MQNMMLKIGCNQPLPPLSEERDGVLQGLEPDIIRLVCQLIDRTPSWCYFPFPDLPDKLDAGEFDALMFNFAETRERAQRFALSRPYGGTDMAIIVRKDSGVEELEDLRDRVVGAVRGTTNLEMAEQVDGPSAIRVYDPGMKVMGMMIEDLIAGEIDAALDDEVPLRAIADRVPEIQVRCTIPTSNRYVIGFRRVDAELRDAVDEALAELAATGELSRVYERWVGQPFPEYARMA